MMSVLEKRRGVKVFFFLPLLLAGGILLLAFFYPLARVRVRTIGFQSKLVRRSLPYDVVLPRDYSWTLWRQKQYPVLFLLHPWNAHSDSWIRETSLVKYASISGLIIVLPEGDNGWYTDSATESSLKYETYLVQELIPEVESRFRVIQGRNGRAIAGISMGGYGAIKFGLKHPDLFCFVASSSGALDAPSRTDNPSIMKTFGAKDNPTRSSNDLFKLVNEMTNADIERLPQLSLDCGSDDPWVGINRDFVQVLAGRHIRHNYVESSGGHDWSYWQKQVPEIIRNSELFLSANGSAK